MTRERTTVIWRFLDGRPGHENQVRGLSEALEDTVVGIRRDANPVVLDLDRAVGMEGDGDALAVAGQGLVHGVVQDLLEEVVVPFHPRAADVHGRAVADPLQALEHPNGRSVVAHPFSIPQPERGFSPCKGSSPCLGPESLSD